MQSEDSQKIVGRFFDALQMLIAAKIIRGKQTFTREYGINRWNLNTLEGDHTRDIFQPAWLTYLVRDFHVSPRWLLCGTGEFFDTGWDAAKVKAKQPKIVKTSDLQAVEK